MNGLYLHIPFCSKRCIYCNFYSTTLKSTFQKSFIHSLCNEITIRANELPSRYLDSIYIGGGTPSVLSPSFIALLFQTIQQEFIIDEKAEITIEVNPDDVTPHFLQSLNSTPINRISMGVQSFNDSILQLIHRRHSATQAIYAIHLLKEYGYHNISLDLIYSLPSQTISHWENDLDKVFSLPITHLSAYALSYEEGTPLMHLREQGRIKETSEQISLTMYNLLMDKAKSVGFNHYEISNFALPNYQARHNSGYWNDMHYLGCGPSAHSYDGTKRRWINPDINSYLKFQGNVIENQCYGEEILSPTMLYNEYLLKRLRTAEGISLQDFSNRFGSDATNLLIKQCTPFIQQNNILHQNNKLSLTRKALFISDDIISSLFKI